MAHTFVEKILAHNAGVASLAPGQVIEATPSVALSHDNSAAISKIFRDIGLDRVKYPERLAITLDHAVPPPTTRHAQNHAEIRAFVREQGITHFYEVGRGICHQVLCEEGLIKPGTILLGADSHSTHCGALGAFGAGIGRSEMAAIWATGQLWLRVPESIKITLEGQLNLWVTAKDVALYLIGTLGADAGLYASVEFHGSAITHMSMASRFVLTNMMAEMGAKNSWVQPDDVTFHWLASGRNNSTVSAGSKTTKTTKTTKTMIEAMEDLRRRNAPFIPHVKAHYQAEYTFDVSALEPQIACPHAVENVVPLSEVAGRRVQQAFLGTCTNGRLEDIAEAARVVHGKRIATGTRLLVIPASSQVYLDALQAGYIETLLTAGAAIGTPGCGPCMGNHMGVPAPNEVTISSANRNFQGRMGTQEAEIYLASPAVVAASAIAGEIIHPEGVTND